ncbi:hypothetical protein ACG04R_09505 [Roseateles sp. BYS78W]|uniref:DUF1444 family protein n=1 Tax=Pelomonas candidula TaxID=3299025 RepID=A0ABW7HBP7_9BURK
MSFLDRLLGRPTLDGLIRDTTRWLQANGCTDIQASPERQEIRLKRGGGTHVISLGNLRREYENAPRAQRQALLQKFLASLMVDNAIPEDYATARPRLMPVVRSVGGMGLVRLGTASAKDAPPGSQAAQRPLAADLVVALVVDLPDSMVYVQDRNLAQWGVSLEQALQDAIDNLRGLPEHGGWAEMAPGVWAGQWGDAYESSRLLIPDLIYRLGIADPVAMAPFRHALLVTSAANAAGIQALVQIAHNALDEQGRWVSFELLRLQGTTWTRFEASGDAAAQQAQMLVRSAADDYEGQRQVLEGQFEADKLDIFVASCTLMQKEGGPLTSYSVWSENVDTLLPQSESVVLLYRDGEKTWHTRLRWSTVQEQFGALMERTDHVPARWRVRRFPERDVLHALAAKAALD